MKRYGFIQEGYFRAVDATGMSEEQLSVMVAAGWKPIDDIDESKMQCEDGYFVKITPKEESDRISISYEKVLDIGKLRNDIESAKRELTESDYKVIKCYEYVLVGKIPPYDIEILHIERQKLRDLIYNINKAIEKKR